MRPSLLLVARSRRRSPQTRKDAPSGWKGGWGMGKLCSLILLLVVTSATPLGASTFEERLNQLTPGQSILSYESQWCLEQAEQGKVIPLHCRKHVLLKNVPTPSPSDVEYSDAWYKDFVEKVDRFSKRAKVYSSQGCWEEFKQRGTIPPQCLDVEPPPRSVQDPALQAFYEVLDRERLRVYEDSASRASARAPVAGYSDSAARQLERQMELMQLQIDSLEAQAANNSSDLGFLWFQYFMNQKQR